jgi:hypothetical protein
MAVYTKEFLVAAFMSRYNTLPSEKRDSLNAMANRFYDEAGKDKFRVYASLDADAIRTYKNTLKGTK